MFSQDFEQSPSVVSERLCVFFSSFYLQSFPQALQVSVAAQNRLVFSEAESGGSPCWTSFHKENAVGLPGGLAAIS